MMSHTHSADRFETREEPQRKTSTSLITSYVSTLSSLSFSLSVCAWNSRTSDIGTVSIWAEQVTGTLAYLEGWSCV